MAKAAHVPPIDRLKLAKQDSAFYHCIAWRGDQLNIRSFHELGASLNKAWQSRTIADPPHKSWLRATPALIIIKPALIIITTAIRTQTLA